MNYVAVMRTRQDFSQTIIILNNNFFETREREEEGCKCQRTSLRQCVQRGKCKKKVIVSYGFGPREVLTPMIKFKLVIHVFS